MSRLLIIYASQTETGRARRLVDAAAQGAAGEPSVACEVLRADAAGPDDLRRSDGLLLVTPEHFGYMAGKIKDFFDRTFYPVEGQTVGLPYALIVSCGNDGRGTVSAVERIVAGYRWKPVSEAQIVVGDPDASALQRAHDTGLAVATGIALGAF
jgi:flavodoxin